MRGKPICLFVTLEGVNWLLKTKNTKLVARCRELGGVWLVQVAETDWLTCVPPLGMQLTCPSRVVQPFATSPCPAYYQPSPRVVHLVLRRISVGVQLGFVKGKKINGSAFHADSARLALLGWKRAWIPPGDSKCYLIRNCLPFHMLFTQPSNIGCLSLSETVYVLIQVFTTYKSTNDSSF